MFWIRSYGRGAQAGWGFIVALALVGVSEPTLAHAQTGPDGSTEQDHRVPSAITGATPANTPRLVIIRTDVLPSITQGAARGLGVIRRGDRAMIDIEIEGLAVGSLLGIEVENTPARIEELSAEAARRYGLETPATRFVARLSLPADQDTVEATAYFVNGDTANAMAAVRIDQRWAVVIGIDDYLSDDVPDLRYAGRDAQAMYDFLRGPTSNLEEDHILFLRDREATGQAIREAMFVFLQQADYDDLVVIYFAGHGAPDPIRPENLYMLPVDADMEQLAATAFPMWDITTALRRQIKAERVIVITDACHSGGTMDGGTAPNAVGLEGAVTPSRQVILSAASDNELSFEDAKWGGGHGVFTHHLIDGLMGAADADSNDIVTFAEVADYVVRRVQVDTGGRQNPQRAGLGDVPLSIVAALDPHSAQPWARAHRAFDRARDRGPGLSTSMFGTYIKRGEFLFYPFVEKHRAREGLIFLGYGISERLAVEFEAALIPSPQVGSPVDPSSMLRGLDESGPTDVEGRLRWRWNQESDARPEVFTYLETVLPLQSQVKPNATRHWEFKVGTGMVRGFAWGTTTVRAALAYDEGEGRVSLGEYAVEYLRRLSPSLRAFLGLEGTEDEVELITEAQWFLRPNVYLKVNNAFGLASQGRPWKPEIGIMFSFR